MLSNSVVTKQRFVLIVDEINQERLAHKFVRQLLREQKQHKETFKVLSVSPELNNETTFQSFAAECTKKTTHKWNVLLPTLSDLLFYQRPALLFKFFHQLRKSKYVRRVFVWATVQNISEKYAPFAIASCEYMADLVLHLRTPTECSIITRKSGGSVTYKRYNCKKDMHEFRIELAKNAKMVKSNDLTTTKTTKPKSVGTFKIELNEDEIVARNAMKLPFENIPTGYEIYAPYDYDDEDPDEDLTL